MELRARGALQLILPSGLPAVAAIERRAVEWNLLGAPGNGGTTGLVSTRVITLGAELENGG
jgi:hypothetical protein